jgi:hypothetical protein
MLADRQVDPLDEGGVDLPALRRQHLLDGSPSAEDDLVTYAHQAPAPILFDHLGDGKEKRKISVTNL